MRIALEEHFVLDAPAHVERWATLVPGVPKAILERILPVLSDVGPRRLEAMSAAGIDLAVLSNVASVQGVLDAAGALRLARQANDHLAEVVRQHPTRYAGLATVPLQDPAAGADELERAVGQLGFKGALVIGHTNGVYLDDEGCIPFWERVEALGVPVYLHASDAPVMPVTYAGRPELMGATWSWGAETAAHTLRMVFAGVFRRHPTVKLLLGHMGEMLPYLLWRLDARAQAFSEDEAVRPGAVIRGNVSVTTAGVFSDEPLTCALQSLGEDAVMFAVDHPFEDMATASAWIDAAPVSDVTREKILSGNAVRILKL